MRKTWIMILSLLLIALLAAPAMAGITFQVNERDYEPHHALDLEAGVTLASTALIHDMYGAAITIEDQSAIKIQKDDRLIEMRVGQAEVSLNGEPAGLLPRVPMLSGDQVLVPFRAVSELLGADIGWEQENRMILVSYRETREGLSPQELLDRSSLAMAAINTYKMRAEVDMLMEMKAPGQEVETQSMRTYIEASLQEEPLLMYMETRIVPEAPLEGEEMVAELVLNEDGFFMLVPDAGWVAFDIPGLDMKDLIEEYGSQDPIKTAEQLQEFGAIFTFADDRSRAGSDYYIIRITMDPSAFSAFMASFGEQFAQIGAGVIDDDEIDFNLMMQEILQNLELYMVYDIWINQEDYMMEYMDLLADITMVMDIQEAELPGKVEISIHQQAAYEIYDFGVPIQVPEITDPISMEQWMAEMMQAMPVQEMMLMEEMEMEEILMDELLPVE